MKPPAPTQQQLRAPRGTELLWGGGNKSSAPLAADDPAHSLLGRVLDQRFQITKVLGRGGMGVVYEGVDKVLERLVVIKVITPRVAESGGARLVREARLAARVQHPSIVTVFHLGVLDHIEPFIVMEKLDGKDLATVLSETGPLPLVTTVALLEPVADALAALHAHGVVHRDLKPENLFVLEGRLLRPRVKLIDFGLAMIDDETMARFTRQGHVLGTAEYMAPECARGGAPTPAADVYSLACTAFELLTGAMPFPGTGMDALIAKTQGSPRKVDEFTRDPIVRAAGPVIERALSRDPAARPTASEFLEELRAALKRSSPRGDATINDLPTAPRIGSGPSPAAGVAPTAPASNPQNAMVWVALGASVLSLVASLVSLLH